MTKWFARKEIVEEIISEEEKTRRALLKVARQLEKNNSFRHSFLKGIVTGVGTFLGATIVVGLLLGLLSQLLDITKQVDAIRIIIDRTDIEQVVKQNN